MFIVNHNYLNRGYTYDFNNDIMIVTYPNGQTYKIDLIEYFESSDIPSELFGNLVMEFICAPYIPGLYTCNYAKSDVINVIKNFNDTRKKSVILALLYVKDEELCYYSDKEVESIQVLEKELKNIICERDYKIAIMEYKLKNN